MPEPDDEEEAAEETLDVEADEPRDADVDLASVCPDPFVIQTGWMPEAERGFIYGMVGPGGEIDTAHGVYRGPSSSDPNLTIEIRAGGPMVGFQSRTSLLYQDPEIFMVDMEFDGMIADSGGFPTVGVMTPFEKSPIALMWDPTVYRFESIEEIRDSDAIVLVDPNVVYPQVLVGLGKLNAAQIDDSFDFSPSRFVAEEGRLVQQGFASSDGYLYEHTIEAWNKPIDFLLLSDEGYPTYAVVLAVKPETIDEHEDCLGAIVPEFQRSQVEYMSNPDPVNEVLVQLSRAFEAATPATMEHAADAVRAMLEMGMVSNGNTGMIGDFDLDRVDEMIDLTIPAFQEQGRETFDPNLTPEQLVTSEFLDPTVALPDDLDF